VKYAYEELSHAQFESPAVFLCQELFGISVRFSDSDFFSATSETTVVGKELGRIKRLRAGKELDHYVLFSNRKLGGEAEAAIRSHISTTCGIPVGSVYLL
jgi:hypothetical protein